VALEEVVVGIKLIAVPSSVLEYLEKVMMVGMD
jgi:hypothetical protein